jgi:hypothetical protein
MIRSCAFCPPRSTQTVILDDAAGGVSFITGLRMPPYVLPILDVVQEPCLDPKIMHYKYVISRRWHSQARCHKVQICADFRDEFHNCGRLNHN